MSLFGGIHTPGHPDIPNIQRLDLLPVPMIRRMMRVGFAIDREYMWELSRQFAADMARLKREITSHIPPDRLDDFTTRSVAIEEEEGDASINPSSAEQIGKLLFDILDVGHDKKLKMTSKGDRLSTGKKQLELVKGDHPVVQLVLAYREVSKLRSTYTEGLPELARFHPRGGCCPICELSHATDQWRVHGEIGTTRAETGRFNHKNPNLGNIPTRTDNGQMVQAGFVAAEGKRLVTRDLSQIELRCLAHLANCRSMIDVYLNDGDLHDDTCHRALGVPWDEKPDKIKHRMAAKRCIAGGQLVLTNHGLIPIEKVTRCDKVWDGLEWVEHGGVVSNGIQQVINWDGLWSTPDHVVWTTQGIMYAEEARRQRVNGVTGGFEEDPIRYVDDNIQPLSEAWIPSCRGLLSHLFRAINSPDRQYPQWKYYRLQMSEEPEVSRFSATPIGRSLSRYRTALLQSSSPRLSQLWRERYPELIQLSPRVRRIYTNLSSASGLQRDGYRPKGQRWTLPTREFEIGVTFSKSTKQTNQQVGYIQRTQGHSRRLVPMSEIRLPELPTQPTANARIGSDRSYLATNLAAKTKEAEVFDLVNAGPRHRYVVENKLVANTNFGIQNGTTEKGLYLQLVMDFGTSGIPIPDWLTEDWCKQFINDWLDSRPEVRDYFELQWYRARRYGLVWDMFGRCRLVPEVKSTHNWIREAGLRQAQNMPVTSTAAGQMKLAMGRAEAALQPYYTAESAWPLMTIHDALMFEVDEEKDEEVQDHLSEAFDGCMDDMVTGERQFRVPIKSDGDSVTRWVK